MSNLTACVENSECIAALLNKKHFDAFLMEREGLKTIYEWYQSRICGNSALKKINCFVLIWEQRISWVFCELRVLCLGWFHLCSCHMGSPFPTMDTGFCVTPASEPKISLLGSKCSCSQATSLFFKRQTWLISILFSFIPVSASYCCFLDFSPERCFTDLELSTPIWCEDVKSISFPRATLFVSSAWGRH